MEKIRHFTFTFHKLIERLNIALQVNAGWKYLNQAPINDPTYSSDAAASVIYKSYFRPGKRLQNNTSARHWTKLKNSFNLLALFVVTDICMSLTVSKSHRFSIGRHFGSLKVLTGEIERCFPWISKFFYRAHSHNFRATWKYGTERSSGIARFSFPPSDLFPGKKKGLRE